MYETPNAELVELIAEDVIMTSNGNSGDWGNDNEYVED